jgi:hypothetical protein
LRHEHHRVLAEFEAQNLCGKILDTVNLYLDRKGICVTTGTIVDATIVAAPSSTKSSKKERDPQMHQTKKQSVLLRRQGAHRRQ